MYSINILPSGEILDDAEQRMSILIFFEFNDLGGKAFSVQCDFGVYLIRDKIIHEFGNSRLF